MGVYLPKPKTEKELEDGGDLESDTRFGLSAMQGWRQYMEDAHLARPSFGLSDFPASAVFGVFDGHGGPAVSAWVANAFPDVFREEFQAVREAIAANTFVAKKEGLSTEVASICEALQQTFLKLDEVMKTSENRQELRLLHQLAEKKKQDEVEEDSEEDAGRRPESLLDAIVSGVGGSRPIIRVIEQDGQKFYQLVSRDLSPDDDEETEEKGGRVEDLGAKVEEPAVTEGKAVAEEDSGAAPIDENEGQEAPPPTEEEDGPPVASTIEAASKEVDVSVRIADSETADVKEAEADSAETAEDDGERLFGMQPYQPECCGTTAIVATLIEFGDTTYLITANAGDSRAVLCRDGKAVALSVDHKPGLFEETRRILRAGGRVVNGRVDGNLNLSRSLGDLLYKDDANLRPEEQKITGYPDVRVLQLTPKDEFVIIACDGIWDCLTNEDAVDVVQRKLAEGPEGKPLSKICEEICDLCLSEHPLESEGGIGCDNMTMMIVMFNPKLRSKAKDVESEIIFYGEEPEHSEADQQPRVFVDYGIGENLN